MKRMTVKMVFMILLATMVLMFVFTGQALAETPGTPTLVSPGHGEIVHGTSVTFQWTPVSGATHYAIWIYNLTSDNQEYFEVVNLGEGDDTAFLFNALTDNRDIYAWSVVAHNIDDGTWSDFATPLAFIDGSDADLLPPTLVTPEHNSNVSGTQVELQWEAPAGATHYAVWVYNLTEDELVTFSDPIEDTSYIVEGLADNGDIYAWTAVANDFFTGTWSDFAFPRLFTNALPPHLKVDPDNKSIWGHEWPGHILISVIIEEYDEMKWEEIWSGSTDSNEWGDFDFSHIDLEILPGHRITVTDEETTKVHIVTELRNVVADPDTNTISGEAAVGSEVGVEIHDGPGQEVTAESDGTWEWVVDPAVFEIKAGTSGIAWQSDEDHDETHIHFRIDHPNFWVDKCHNGIDGDEWLPGEIITVSIEEHADELGWAEVWSGETETNQWGHFSLQNIEHEIVTGNRVTVTDGVTIKEHIVTELRDVSVDPEANTVSGKAEAGTEVYVHIHEHDTPYRVVTVETDGTWIVSFNEAVGEDPRQQAYDLSPGTHGSADQFDEDGDQTSYCWYVPSPHFTVNPRWNDMWGGGWAADAELVVTIGDPGDPDWSGTAHTNEWGDFFLSVDLEYDIVKDDVISITDGTITRTHRVEYLRITDVDYDNNIIYGEAEANREDIDVIVFIGEEYDDHPYMFVNADGDGNWYADFSGIHDIDSDSDIHAHVRDEEENGTFAGWREPSTRISVNPVQNDIDGSDWDPEVDVNITVKDYDDNEVYSVTVQPSIWGHWQLDHDDALDIQAGYIITAVQDELTKTHTVRNLTVNSVNEMNNSLSGTADPGSEVRAILAGEHFEIVLTTADEDGLWTAVFSYDINPESEGWVAQYDDTVNYRGNHTWLKWPDDITD